MAASPDSADLPVASDDLCSAYLRVREVSEQICQPLLIEDYGVQTMPDVSPPKWHLAHVSWFFETFILNEFVDGYPLFHPDYVRLFNSYYEQIGGYHPRPQRGLLSRPTLDEVMAYRAHVDKAMLKLLESGQVDQQAVIRERVIIGLNHEQQHQELLFTDIKHILGMNPLRPAYREIALPQRESAEPQWVIFSGGLLDMGAGGAGVAVDKAPPDHGVWRRPLRDWSPPHENH